MTFDKLIPITAAGIPVGSIPSELLEAVINLASERPIDLEGVPVSTEEVLGLVQRAIAGGGTARAES